MPSNGANAAVRRCTDECDDKPCAIISDIHSNLAALEAVLADIDGQGVKHVCCLGDIVGYGPNPVECWRLLKRICHPIIRGNHDQALSRKGISRFHPRARKAIDWTLARLAGEADGLQIARDLIALPPLFTCRGRLFVHGSPAGATMDYLLPGDCFDAERMAREFRHVETSAFNGHTHIPGVIEKGGAFISPEKLNDMTYIAGQKPAIINVGSVGQPRDGNSKACYVVLDGNAVRYRRVQYDIEKIRRQILKLPNLDPFFGDRLLKGQ